MPSKLGGGGEIQTHRQLGNFINLLTKINGDTLTDGQTQFYIQTEKQTARKSHKPAFLFKIRKVD
jgi:hypothetical protein